MKNPLKFFLILAVIIGVVIFGISFMGPGVNDLAGNFKEIDAWQNENNTGPVNRVYIVTVSDTLWNEMEAYGNYMPYAKLGTTNVWFFLDSQPFPNKITPVKPGQPPFAASYQQACIGRYEKNNVGTVRVMKMPFQ